MANKESPQFQIAYKYNSDNDKALHSIYFDDTLIFVTKSKCTSSQSRNRIEFRILFRLWCLFVFLNWLTIFLMGCIKFFNEFVEIKLLIVIQTVHRTEIAEEF